MDLVRRADKLLTEPLVWRLRMDGIKTCLKIREGSDTPLIMLSAKEEDIKNCDALLESEMQNL